MSSHQRQLLRFAQYNRWFNERLFSLLEGIDDEERKRDLGAFFGSIHATLDHVLLCDRIWLGRFARSSIAFPSLEHAALVHPPFRLDQGVEPEFEDLRREREATDGVLEAFVRELVPGILERELHYQNSKGTSLEAPVWHVVAHVFNHQTHHRGQLTTLLSQLGHDPGPTDFIITALMPLEP